MSSISFPNSFSNFSTLPFAALSQFDPSSLFQVFTRAISLIDFTQPYKDITNHIQNLNNVIFDLRYRQRPTHYNERNFEATFEGKFAVVFEQIRQRPYYELYKQVAGLNSDAEAYSRLLTNCRGGTCYGTTLELIKLAKENPSHRTSELVDSLDHSHTLYNQAIGLMRIEFLRTIYDGKGESFSTEGLTAISSDAILAEASSPDDGLPNSLAQDIVLALKNYEQYLKKTSPCPLINIAIKQIEAELNTPQLLEGNEFNANSDLRTYRQEINKFRLQDNETITCCATFNCLRSAPDEPGHAIFIRLSPGDYSLYDIQNGCYQFHSEQELLDELRNRGLRAGFTKVQFIASRSRSNPS